MSDIERLVIKAWEFAGLQMGLNITDDPVIKTFGLNIKNTEKVFEKQLDEGIDFYALRKIRVDYVTEYIKKAAFP